MLRIIISFLLIFLGVKVYSKSKLDLTSITKQYANYNAVILDELTTYIFDIVDDSLVVSQTYSKDVLILNKFSKGLSSDYIGYDSFSSIEDLEAFTQVPKGSKFTKVYTTQFEESNSTGDGIFYDDSKLIKLIYPSVQQGAITTLNYKVSFNNPRFLRNIYLQTYIPVLKSKVIFKVHEDVKVGAKILNTELTKLNTSTYIKGKYTYYTWEVEHVQPYHQKSGKYYSRKNYSPHIVPYVEETNINGINESYFDSISDLYSFYSSFLSELENEPSAELHALVEQITKGLRDDEKVKIIYEWVQNNIKYVAYSQGYMGFIPMPSQQVFAKRYGDCKGMSNLINEMLSYAGITGYYTWVGTRHIPYTYEEMPLPNVDNHMVSTYIKDDSIIILDGTFKFLEYGIPPYHVQGKELLIGLNDKIFKLYKVPIIASDYSVKTDSVYIKFNNGGIEGSGMRKHTGYYANELAYGLNGYKKENYNKRLSKLFAKESNKFTLTSHIVHNVFRTDTAASIGYDFKIPDYGNKIGDEIFININIDQAYKDLIIDTTENYSPIENDFYCEDVFITIFEIPEGFKLDYLPPNASYDNESFSYSIEYSIQENLVTQRKRFEFDFLLVTEEQVDDWNNMIQHLNRQYREALVLKR